MLLAAAARMFNARGFHAASLDDVAASVGVTRPTICHYLGNKKQVLIECMRFGLAQLQDAGAAVAELRGKAADRLCAFLVRYALVNMTEFCLCVVRPGDELLSPEGLETLRAPKRPIGAARRTMIADGMADGSIAAHDPKFLAFTLAGAVNGIGGWYDPAGSLPPEWIAREMVAALEAGFVFRPAAV